MSVSSIRISMHQSTYSLMVGSILSVVIGSFLYRLVGNQIADSERSKVGFGHRGRGCRSSTSACPAPVGQCDLERPACGLAGVWANLRPAQITERGRAASPPPSRTDAHPKMRPQPAARQHPAPRPPPAAAHQAAANGASALPQTDHVGGRVGGRVWSMDRPLPTMGSTACSRSKTTRKSPPKSSRSTPEMSPEGCRRPATERRPAEPAAGVGVPRRPGSWGG
jgi:hypothetical protein